MKYALIGNGVVDNIAYDEFPGYIEVPDTVFGGFTQNGDGSFSPPAAPPTPAPTATDVDAERDRRISTGFVFQGHAIQLDDASQVNMTAMGASARFAVLAGAVAGNLRWSDPNNDFGWIATDNSVVTMDAPTMAAMADAAKAWVSANIFAARTIKNLSPIPSDYATASRWPAPAS